MIRLAWRIALFGRGTARVTLAVRAAGIGLGVAILLLAAASGGALDERGDRISWRDMGAPVSPPASTDTRTGAWDVTDRAMHVLTISDRYDGQPLERVMVADLNEPGPVPPGVPAAPAAGEAFVSPALLDLIEADPEGLLPRLGAGVITGVIDDDGLADPDELVAIIGAHEEDLPRAGLYFDELPLGAVQPSITAFLRIIAIIGAVVLLAPVALFIAAAARLDAQQGEVRLAAMRLAGASPSDVRRYVAAEATLAIVPGLLVGLALFFAARQFAPYLAFMGHGFYPGDVTLSPRSFVLLLLVPLLVVGSSIYGMRGVEVSPLGVRRGANPGGVRPFGPLMVIGGLALYAWGLSRPPAQLGEPMVGLVIGVGMLLVLFGLALTGPWLGQHLGRLLAGRVRSGSLLIAFRRIASDPRTSFRTVAGVSFAVFLGTFFLTVTDAAEREVESQPNSGLRPGVLLVQHIAQDFDDPPPELVGPDTIALTYTSFLREPLGPDNPSGTSGVVYLGDCATLALAFPIEYCKDAPVLIAADAPLSAGQEIVALERGSAEGEPFRIPAGAGTFQLAFAGWSSPSLIVSPELWPVEDPTRINIPRTIVIPEDGADLEALRSEVIRQVPAAEVLTAAEQTDEANSNLHELRQLVYLGILGAFLISGATGTISIAGSLLARRVPFSLLRLTGCPPGLLRRALFAEAILPLALVAMLSVGLGVTCGLLAAWLGGTGPVEVPSTVVLPLVAGLLLGTALLMPVLPLVERVTRFGQTRFD